MLSEHVMMTGIEISSDYLGVRNEEGKLIVRITHIDFINMTVTTHKGEVHPFSGVFTVLGPAPVHMECTEH
jgi:hypothetical protein